MHQLVDAQASVSAPTRSARRLTVELGGLPLEVFREESAFFGEDVFVALDGDEDGLLGLLSGVEAHSEHHSAAAIRQEAARRSVVAADVLNVNTRPSAGIVGEHAEGLIWAGNPRLVSEMGASVDDPALEVQIGRAHV